MAKKKTAETANIKAAPVLRAQSGGDDPTPETPVITKSYCVRDDWKDQDIVNYVAFKSVDGEVQDLTVNGEPASGGSISTASVVVTNNYRSYATVYFISVTTNGQLVSGNENMINGITTTFNNVAVIDDKVIFKTQDARTMVVASGSAQMISGSKAIITGDCALTITA